MIDEDMPSGKARPPRTEEAAPQPRRRAPAREQRWPENLPVVEEVIDPPEVKEAPQQWRCIGRKSAKDSTTNRPGSFAAVCPAQVRLAPRIMAAPVIARLPAMLQEHSLPAAGLLAQIIVSKYCDHVPLYRQEQIYWTRHRVWLPRQNQARWVGMVADWFQPIYHAIRSGVMAGGYVQVDETPVHYLCPGHGKTKIGYFWTASRPGGEVVYQWQTSRGAACLDKVLPVDFKGTVQCDAYPAYASFARRKEHLQLAAVGRTPDENFLRPATRTRAGPDGCCVRSGTSTASNGAARASCRAPTARRCASPSGPSHFGATPPRVDPAGN